MREPSAASATQAREAARPQPLASFQPAWMGQSKVVRGTVSRLDVDFNRTPQWLTIFFRESPDAAFVACSPYPDMLQDKFGDLSALVGKTLEVSGQVEPAMCRGGKGASIRLLESKQFVLKAGPPPGRIVAAGGGAAIPRRQGARVGLDICNAGEIEFDAFVVMQGRAVNHTSRAARLRACLRGDWRRGLCRLRVCRWTWPMGRSAPD